jgi:hypothetical protein
MHTRIPRIVILAGFVALATTGCQSMSGRDADGATDRNAAAPDAAGDDRAGTWSTPGESLHDRVHDALMERMGPKVNDVGVTVSGTAVTLTGSVRSQADRQQAHDIAHGVRGATSVDISALAVKP